MTDPIEEAPSYMIARDEKYAEERRQEEHRREEQERRFKQHKEDMLENRQIHERSGGEQFRDMVPETIFSLSNQLCHSNNKLLVDLHLHQKRERHQKLQK